MWLMPDVDREQERAEKARAMSEPTREPFDGMWCPNHRSRWFFDEGACEWRMAIYYHYPEKDWKVDPCADAVPFDAIARKEGYIRPSDICLVHRSVRIGVHLNQCEYHGPLQVVPCHFPTLDKGDTDE